MTALRTPEQALSASLRGDVAADLAMLAHTWRARYRARRILEVRRIIRARSAK